MNMVKKWIQEATSERKKGALHRQLGIPQDKTIPKKMLHRIKKARLGTRIHGVSVTPLLKKRVNFAINVQKRRKR